MEIDEFKNQTLINIKGRHHDLMEDLKAGDRSRIQYHISHFSKLLLDIDQIVTYCYPNHILEIEVPAEIQSWALYGYKLRLIIDALRVDWLT
jgi:hypothetical protein